MLPPRVKPGSGASPGPAPIKSLVASFRYALRGLADCLRNERNLRIHITAALWVIALGRGVGLSTGEWAALAVCCGLVIGSELFNTAVEATVDLLSPDYHPIARRAKDIAAAGVLVGALFAILTGCIVFWGKLDALGLLAGQLARSPLALGLVALCAAASWVFIFYYPLLCKKLFKNREEHNLESD